jgi:hypothetical protein
MGLDMYLTVEESVSGYTYSADSKSPKFDDLSALSEFEPAEDSPMLTITTTVAYWRKANAIHAWFVENVQKGVDECQRSYVSVEQLEQLLTDVRAVLESPSKAAETLPTQSGFFFGSTDYDEYYTQDLARTLRVLTPVVDRLKAAEHSYDFGIFYQASW